MDAYLSGHAEGVAIYCSAENAFALGQARANPSMTCPAPLADRCVALLKERLAVRMKDGKFTPSHGASISSPDARVWGMAPNWQELTARLFDLAGQVEAAGDGARQAGAMP